MRNGSCSLNLFLVVLAALLPGCSTARSLAATFRSTANFVPLASETRVLHEPGAEPFALQIAPLLPEAVAKVETALNSSFDGSVRVYVCATAESCRRLSGSGSPAVVTKKLFLSPSLFDGKRPLDRYLIHELTHLHLIRRIGVVRMIRLPEWFREGLAELVSGGATGSTVSEEDALRAIREGRGFLPGEGRNAVSSFLFPRYGSHWKLDQPMFYRQCMLFTAFLRDMDRKGFERFVGAIEKKESFKMALGEGYPEALSALWNGFIEREKLAGQTGAP